MASNGNGNGNSRILTKDLDARLKAVEQRLDEIVDHLSQLELRAQESPPVQPATPEPAEEAGNGKLAELEAQVTRLDDRVEKITQTIVTQASRWT
ncbi:MAG: hypothetical protein ACREQN_12480 [Candidatus Binataceae bacterium]